MRTLEERLFNLLEEMYSKNVSFCDIDFDSFMNEYTYVVYYGEHCIMLTKVDTFTPQYNYDDTIYPMFEPIEILDFLNGLEKRYSHYKNFITNHS